MGATIPPKDPRQFIRKVSDVRDSIVDNFKHGGAKGETTFIPDIDGMFKWKKTFINTLTGYQNHGKSQFLVYLCLAKAIGDGSKFAFYTPEGNDAPDWYEELIHCLCGQTTDKDYDQISEDRLEWAMEFLDKHFFFIQAVKGSHKEVLSAFKYLKETEDLYGCIIDGYNSLVFDTHSQEYLQIRNFLIDQRIFTNNNNVCTFVVVHPRNTGKDQRGEVPEPDVYTLSGGAEWGNKGDIILCYNRPRYWEDRLDTSCYIKSLKIKKQKLIALPGQCDMTFNRATNRYLFNGQDLLQDLINKKLRSPLQPSNEFTF